MEYKLTILGRLDGMNEYTAACRTHYQAGGKMKKKNQEAVVYQIRQQLCGVHIDKPVKLSYTFYEPNKRRDLDNISSFAHKVIQDALVKEKILADDGWNEIIGYEDRFQCDKEHPRIELAIWEADVNGR